MGYYHQDERDIAAGIGFFAIIVIMVLAVIVFSIAMAKNDAHEVFANDGYAIMDGSDAGSNAVTLEELEAENELRY